MKFKIMLTISLLLLVSACTSYKSYSQATGFAAPFEYQVNSAVTFCALNLSLSDTYYIEEERDLVLPVLRDQVIRYINADGRLHIQDKNCSDKSLSIDFVSLTDHWEDDSPIYSAQSQVDVSYKGQEFGFIVEEVSKNENRPCVSCKGIYHANSARNKGRLINKVITAVITRVEESDK